MNGIVKVDNKLFKLMKFRLFLSKKQREIIHT
jgi:hypothetical protein